jgi:hypothetical protein
MNPFQAPAVGRFRRQVTSILVAMSLSVGMIAANPTPGYAASTVQARFSLNGYYPDPAKFERSEIWGLNANFFLWVEGYGWYYIGSMELSPVGWVGLTVPPGLQNSFIGVQVNDREGAAYFTSGMVIFPPGVGTSIQYARVSCFGCQ